MVKNPILFINGFVRKPPLNVSYNFHLITLMTLAHPLFLAIILAQTDIIWYPKCVDGGFIVGGGPIFTTCIK